MTQHAYAWKLVQSANGKRQEHQHRQTRLADGRKAVQLGTKAQQLQIIKRFEEEICQTPQRKKLYQEAIDRVMDNGETSSTDIEGSKSRSVKDGDVKVDPHRCEEPVEAKVSSSPHAVEEDDDIVFAREIELAMELSLDRAINVEAEDHPST